jgi:predicted nucleotidyltransferase
MATKETAIKAAQSFIHDCSINGLSFSRVFLFGSHVKGLAHEWSDIDLLLVSDQFGDNIFDNLKLYSRVNIKYPNIETHPYPTEYYEAGDDFLAEIMKDSVEIRDSRQSLGEEET